MEKTRYWLKLEKNFMTLPEIKILRKKSSDTTLFYVTLMLESIPTVGHLRISDAVPYDDELLAEAFCFDEDFVEDSMNCYKKLGLVEILEDGTIFMTKVPGMTGKESESARRMRDYRNRKQDENTEEKNEDISTVENLNDSSFLSQCDNNVTKSNNTVIKSDKKKNNVTKSDDNIYIQSKLTTTEYINKINNVDCKLINKINSSCSCCLEESDFFLQIVYNWILHFKDKVSDVVNRAIEIMSLKNNVENKLFFVNGILRNWWFDKCRSIEDVDKLINYEFKFESNSQTENAAALIEELQDYNWLEEG